ncbi:hypothetical protein J4Q44_G00116900 [Coregonus suidteri]|uniref:Uncharacterized protein n=1 Tax=Coregonus suidteri TaxID=861788 RepID=A0AAN8LZ44_9TELE
MFPLQALRVPLSIFSHYFKSFPALVKPLNTSTHASYPHSITAVILFQHCVSVVLFQHPIILYYKCLY